MISSDCGVRIGVCKTFIRRFDSGPRLQVVTRKYSHLRPSGRFHPISANSTVVHGLRGKTGAISGSPPGGAR